MTSPPRSGAQASAAVGERKPALVLGIMSGTSIDSVDYALCRIATDRVGLLRHWQVAFPSALRERLRAAAAARLTRFDLLATLTEFTAGSIALNYRRHLQGWPQQVVLAGGGAANPTLVRRITARLSQTGGALEVVTSDSLGWPQQAIEPAAFALLAYCRIHSLPGNLPETTGARRAALLGQITAPSP